MTKITALAIALTLLGSSAALAQYNGDGPDRNRGAAQQQNRNDDRNDRNDRFDNDRGDRRDGSNVVRDRPHWSRGDRLPREYRDKRYEVTDWRARRLRQPPRGYHWVRADDRYVLAALTTGLIAEIMLNAGR